MNENEKTIIELENLPMYIKSNFASGWMGKLNRTGEYYQAPSLVYNHYDKVYEIKNSCGEKVDDIVKQQRTYTVATDQEYEDYKTKLINEGKEKLKNEIQERQEQLQILENTTF